MWWGFTELMVCALSAAVLLSRVQVGVCTSPLRRTQTFKEVAKDDLWLIDHEGQDMQSDDASPGSRRLTCPPPPSFRRQNDCHRPRCFSDRQCSGRIQRCCNNGCIFTCMSANKPPVFVDWVREPRRRLTSGRSWLVSGPELASRGKQLDEPCSTSIFTPDEAPLLCPHGYICHIDYFGDPQKKVPNRGRCIKDRSYQHESDEEKTEMTSGKGVCMFSKRVFADKSKFIYNHHVCTCQQGAITCKVNTELQDTYT